MKSELRYSDEAGWYAVVGGKIVQDEIDGTWDSAFDAFVAVMDANRESDGEQPGQWEYLP